MLSPQKMYSRSHAVTTWVLWRWATGTPSFVRGGSIRSVTNGVGAKTIRLIASGVGWVVRPSMPEDCSRMKSPALPSIWMTVLRKLLFISSVNCPSTAWP